jgi:hypothetical protein
MSTEQDRKYITEIAFAFNAVSLCSTIWVTSDLMLIRPMHPDYAAGLIYLYAFKGSGAYFSASDCDCVSLCWICSILGFGGVAYAVGRTNETALFAPPSNNSFGVVFLISIVVVAGSFLLFGRWMGDFLSAHGIVLRF